MTASYISICLSVRSLRANQFFWHYWEMTSCNSFAWTHFFWGWYNLLIVARVASQSISHRKCADECWSKRLKPPPPSFVYSFCYFFPLLELQCCTVAVSSHLFLISGYWIWFSLFHVLDSRILDANESGIWTTWLHVPESRFFESYIGVFSFLEICITPTWH